MFNARGSSNAKNINVGDLDKTAQHEINYFGRFFESLKARI